jgi:hypothetical protein
LVKKWDILLACKSFCLIDHFFTALTQVDFKKSMILPVAIKRPYAENKLEQARAQLGTSFLR